MAGQRKQSQDRMTARLTIPVTPVMHQRVKVLAEEMDKPITRMLRAMLVNSIKEFERKKREAKRTKKYAVKS